MSRSRTRPGNESRENPHGIFISYRRGDTGGHAGRLYDDLVEHFGRDRVFRDIDALQSQLGLDFTEALEHALARSNVVLVLIGPGWLESAAPDGHRRIDDPSDILHQEIAMALSRPGTRVVPILLGGAMMPPIASLPDALKPLARRQAIDISDRRWSFDVGQLIAAIEPLLGPPAQAPRRRSPGVGAVASAISILLLAAAVGALFAFDIIPPDGNETPTPDDSSTEIARNALSTEEADTPTPTNEPQPTDTPDQPEPSPTNTPDPTPTDTPEPTPTDEPEPTETSTEEPTPTPTPDATRTDPSLPSGWTVNGLEHLTDSGGFEAYGINGSGAIVGSFDTGTGDSHAAIWDADGGRALDALPGDPVSAAFSINDAGQAVGWSETADGVSHAVRWEADGKVTALDELPDAAGSSAFSINDEGVVAGSSVGLDGSVHATVWENGEPTWLPPLPGDLESTALDVNNAGQIVGWSGSSVDIQRAVIWEDGEPTPLGEIPGHVASTAFSINDDGLAVGISASSDSDTRAVIWDGDRITELEIPAGNVAAIAFSISGNGMIAGIAADRDGGSSGVIWVDGEATVLDTLPDHTTSGAFAVNDSGQVAGWSTPPDGPPHAVIWEPEWSDEGASYRGWLRVTPGIGSACSFAGATYRSSRASSDVRATSVT